MLPSFGRAADWQSRLGTAMPLPSVDQLSDTEPPTKSPATGEGSKPSNTAGSGQIPKAKNKAKAKAKEKTEKVKAKTEESLTKAEKTTGEAKSKAKGKAKAKSQVKT